MQILEIGSAYLFSGFSAFAVWSHNTILTQPGKALLFFHFTIVGYMISLFFSARQKDIKNGSCK